MKSTDEQGGAAQRLSGVTPPAGLLCCRHAPRERVRVPDREHSDPLHPCRSRGTNWWLSTRIGQQWLAGDRSKDRHEPSHDQGFLESSSDVPDRQPMAKAVRLAIFSTACLLAVAPAQGFGVESPPSLGEHARWPLVQSSASPSLRMNSLSIEPRGGAGFFRLRKL